MLNPNYTVIEKPMADGGEGTIESLLAATKGERNSNQMYRSIR